MFGFGEKKPVISPGDEEKHRIADKMRQLSRAEMQFKSDGGEGELTGSQTIPVAVIFGIAVCFALLVTQGSNTGLTGLHPTGNSEIDNLLFGSSIPTFMGDPDIDRLVIVFVRGTAYFLITAAAPFLAFLLVKTIGRTKVNSFVACWGVTALLPLLLFTLGDVFTFLLDTVAGLL